MAQMPSPHDAHVEQCLNCGHATPLDYCPACGQPAVGAHVSFREQLLDFFGELFSFEARIPQTLKLLFLRPGELTRAYAAGHRVRYVTPLKTFLFAAFVYFGLVSLSEASVDYAAFTRDLAQLRSMMADSLPPSLLAHMESVEKHPQGFLATTDDLTSKVTFVLVPAHALLLKVAYAGTRKVYGEHVVFAFHAHAFRYLTTAGLALVGTLLRLGAHSRLAIPAAWVGRFESVGGTVLFFWTCAYLTLAAKRAYGGGTGEAIAKMVAIGTGYVCVAGVVYAAVLVAAFMSS